MWYLYILGSLSNKEKIYIGSTNDLERRLSEHNRGHTFTTRRFMPWCILYTENYEVKQLARARERQIKNWKNRARIDTLILKQRLTKI